MEKRRFELVWHVPGARGDEQERGGIEQPPALMERLASVPAPSDLGYVEVVGATTAREELIALLELGAEVEHALLVQYLYAAASLDPDDSTATDQLRELIQGIAFQEMAHLVSVQNLLLAVGGPDYLHIGRDGIRGKSKENPLPFALEPVSALTLEEYVLAEAPAEIDDLAKSARIAKMRLEVKATAGIEPHRVGAFYTQIYWLLQPSDSPHGDLPLTPDPAQGRKPGCHVRPEDFADAETIAAHQAQFVEWRGNDAPDMLILPVGDATTPRTALAEIALSNVYTIMEQGEGAPQGEDSHFERFLAALDLLKAGGISVLPLPRTPYAGASAPTEAPAATRLQAPYTTLWAGLFDTRYTMLLLDIGLSLATPAGSPDRGMLRDWAFGNMGFLLRLTAELASPLLAAIEPCGPTFGLLYEDLPSGPIEPWQRYQDLLQREGGLITNLGARPELANDLLGKPLLEGLHGNSATRSDFVTRKLATPRVG